MSSLATGQFCFLFKGATRKKRNDNSGGGPGDNHTGIFKLLHSNTFYMLLTVILSGFVTSKADDDLKYRAIGVIELAIGTEMAKCNLDESCQVVTIISLPSALTSHQ